MSDPNRPFSGKSKPLPPIAKPSNDNKSASSNQQENGRTDQTVSGNGSVPPAPPPAPPPDAPPPPGLPAPAAPPVPPPPPPTIASGDQNNDTSVPNEALNVPVEASAKKGKSKAKKGGIRFMNEVTDIDTGIKEQILSEDVSVKDMRENPYTNLLPDVSQKSVYKTAKVKTVKRERPNASLPKLQFGINDLLEKKSQLRNIQKEYKKVQLNREDVFDKHKEYDHFPLMSVYHDLKEQVLTLSGRLTSLNLSGVEQLTDMFFAVLIAKQLEFKHLSNLNLTGCSNLTDMGMYWVTKHMPSIGSVYLRGCSNITERSIQYFLDGKQVIKDFNAQGANIRLISPKLEKSLALFNFRACPLISPATETYTKSPRNALSVNLYGGMGKRDHSQTHLDVFKITLLRHDPSLPSLGDEVLPPSNSKGLRKWSNWKPLPDSTAEFNVYEVDVGSGFENLVLSNGSVVVVPYIDNKDQSEVLRLAETIMSVLVQYPENVFMLANVSSDHDSKNYLSPAHKRHLVKDVLEVYRKSLQEKLEFVTERSLWYMNEHKYHEQIQYTAARRTLLYLDKLLEENSSLLMTVHFQNEKQSGFGGITEAVDTLQEKYPWHDFGVYPETKNAIKLAHRKEEFPAGFGSLTTFLAAMLDDTKMNLNIRSSYREMYQVFSLMSERGKCSFFPGERENLCIVNEEMLEKLCNGLTERKPEKKMFVSGIGGDVLGYSQSDLTDIIISSAVPSEMTQKLSEKQIFMMLSTLENMGIILKMPCQYLTKDSFAENSFGYVLSRDLPEKSTLVDEFWPPDIPGDELQTQKIYVLPAFPVSLLHCLFSEYSGLYSFSLLWKTGFIVQIGPVTLLLELLYKSSGAGYNNPGQPAIVVASRVQQPATVIKASHEVKKSAATERLTEIMWNALKQLTVILNAFLQKRQIFAAKTLACQNCCPTQNRYEIMKTDNICEYDEIRIKASHDRGLRCRREQQKDQFDIVAYLGSEQVRHGTDFIPNHAIYDKDYEKQIVDSSSSSSPWPTRCFMCANCALEGINCYGNMDNGKTTKHCGCLLPGFLCPFCGICKRCVRQLTLAHSVTHPTFQSKEFTSASEIKNGYIIQTGSLISFAVSAHPYKVNMPMTLENFSHFQVVLTRGIWFTLQITVDKQEIYFNFGEGTLYQEVGDKKNSLDTELDVLRPLKMGDFVDVYLRPENELGDQCLEIQTNLAVLYRRQILNPSVNVSVNANKPGNITLGSTHLRDVQTSLGLKMDLGESASVDLFILKGKNLMDQDVYGSNFNGFHPFVRVKVGGKVVYETNWRTGSQVKWNEHVLFQMSEDAQEVEIVLYNKESMAEELIGIIMYNLEHLRELSEGNERQWVPVPLTKNASIQIKAIVKYLDKQGLEKKDEMVQGHSRNTLIRRCAGWLPTTIEQTLFQFSMDFKSLFENRFLDLAGSAVMISPRELPESRILLPSYQHIKADLLAHPLCMTRTEILEESSKDVQQGWHYHLTNARGYDLIDYKASIAWSWQVLLMHRHKITLPPYDKLFPNISQDFNEDLISRGLHQYLKYLSIHLFLARGIDFKIENFKSMSKLRTNIKYLRQSLSSNIEDSGLMEISSYFSDKRQLYLCPAHVSCWNKKMNFTKVPTDGYDEYYMFIKDLVLTMNNLETIPDNIFSNLINLDHVDLSHNVLRSIPESIGKCKKLRYLGLQENNLTDLPMTLSMCVNLMRINISRNKMDAVPAAIPQCSSLEILMMSDMFITSLPEEMGFMDNLEILYANGNCLTEVPESFSMLQRLTDLSLRGVFWFVRHDVTKMMSRNRFQELLEQHGHSRWLEEHSEDREELFSQFDDNANGILEEEEMGKLNATVFNIFPRLGYKGTETPDDDTPSGFPLQLMFLQNLRYLNLTYQGIVHIPDEIGLLTSLEHLILSYNPNLLSVSAKVGDLPLLTLELEECPLLKTPPKEIRERGFATTYAYLRRLLSGSVECKRTKLMLVGLGEAGKTSLARAMRQEGDLKNSLTGVEDITDGIDISKWIVKHEGDEISYSVWDFAGQTVYYNTHQFFLSNRAVYLLVWNVRLGHEHAGLKFWLSSIRVHAPKAPIFIVGTHVDQVSKVELPTEELKEQFNQIEGFFYVSSYSGQGIPELKQKLFSVTLQQEYMGERIPSAWLELEKIIVRQRNQLHVDTISFENVVNLAGEAGIVDRTEVSQAVQFLHDLGALQHFSSNVYLKSHIVINPQWIVDVMACVVSVKQSAIKEGRLNHRDLGEIWSSYKDDMYQWMLRLTEEFDLTYPVPGEDLEKINIVPCLLPETKTEFTWPEIHKNDDIYETKMVYTFDYLPAGLFNRGQVRLQEYSDSVIIWKTGSFLRKNGHIALLQQYKDTEMIVKVQGPIPENILFHVHEVFEGLILESYQGVHYDFTIPCPDCLKQNLKDPHMFPASIIRRAIELKAPFLQCMKYFHTISIVDLQAVTPPSSNNDFDVHLQKAVSGLQDLRRTMKIDLFISYCDVDAPDDRSEVIHPATVHEDLINAGYTCWFPEVTNKYSTDLMARALMDSTIFVVFMSTSYANDPTCADIFKYAKLTLGKPMVVIVVGEENFSWRKTNLGLLLPDVSFVNMINSKKQMYDGKFRELLQKLDELMNLATRNVSTESPECFISYCWKNSAQAVALGTRAEDKSLGYGDPREIKNYLEEEGVRCWIDVERIGMNGLFDEIAKGLLEAKMVVACVSDEYVQSPSCKKEFHYACTVLNIPIVLCVVGTGSEWRRSEVGILSVNCPIVSFQLESEAANNRLLELVQDSIQKVGKQDNNTNNNKAAEKTTEEEVKNEQQFQELYELAQRKFLRQIVNYASSHDVEPYPRIFMVDLVKQENQSTTQEDPEQEKQDPEKLKASISMEDKSDAFRLRQYCVYILCECDKGWHTVDEPMMLPEDFGSDLLDQFAPYLCRVTAIMKHSKTMVPNFLSDPDGQQYTKWLFESTAAVVPDFKTGYHQFRELVMNLDIHNKAGKLSRCRQTSGKTIWLCSQHVSEMKVTVLGKDTAPIKQKASVQTAINYTEEWLRKLDPKRLEAKFKSSKKADRKPVVYDLPGTRKAAPSSSVRTKKDVLEEIALTKGTTAGEVAKKTALLAELSSATGTAPHRITSKSSKLEREGSATSRTSQKTTKSGQTTPKLKRPTSQACIVM